MTLVMTLLMTLPIFDPTNDPTFYVTITTMRPPCDECLSIKKILRNYKRMSTQTARGDFHKKYIPPLQSRRATQPVRCDLHQRKQI